MKESNTEETKSADSNCQVSKNIVTLWLKYAQLVSDSETVYRHMLSNKIGTTETTLYLEWALVLEKYRRNFDAASLVFQEGLKKVQGEAQEKLLMQKYTDFAERMRLRIKRDVIDPLSKNESESLEELLNKEENILSPGTISKSKKRSYLEAFGRDPPSFIQAPVKRMLLSSEDVQDCAKIVNEYKRGLSCSKA